MKNFKELRTQLNEKYKSKFPSSLVSAAVKIALDMGGNMTGAYKKIEKMKRGLGDDPAVKNALQLANEDFSNFAEEKEIPFGYTFFDKADVTKFKQLIKGLKGLELVSVDKMKGGQFTVRVKGPRKIVAKANAFAIRVMAENNGVNEAKGDFPSSMTYFDKKGATKAEKIAKGLKIYKNTKEVGKGPNFAYTVHVMGSFDKIEKWIDLI